MKMSGEYEPNSGHTFLASLEQQGKHVDIFTQNIDGLHKRREASMYMNSMAPFKRPLVHHVRRYMICLIY